MDLAAPGGFHGSKLLMHPGTCWLLWPQAPGNPGSQPTLALVCSCSSGLLLWPQMFNQPLGTQAPGGHLWIQAPCWIQCQANYWVISTHPSTRSAASTTSVPMALGPQPTSCVTGPYEPRLQTGSHRHVLPACPRLAPGAPTSCQTGSWRPTSMLAIRVSNYRWILTALGFRLALMLDQTLWLQHPGSLP